MHKIIALTAAAVFLVACEDQNPARTAQARKAAEVARSIQFTDNAEIENIKSRVQLTANPGLLGFVLLMNEAGQPILYEGVKGKVTSGGKRLTPTMESRCVTSISSDGKSSTCNYHVVPAPSDEGTYGQSGEYVYYWNQNGEFRQWNGKYLYSDRPFRLRVEPLVVSVEAPKS